MANHFPHLCLVDDWLTEEEDSTNQRSRDATADALNVVVPGLPAWTQTLSPESLQKAFDVGFETKVKGLWLLSVVVGDGGGVESGCCQRCC